MWSLGRVVSIDFRAAENVKRFHLFIPQRLEQRIAEEEAKLAVFPPVLRSGQSSEGQSDLMSSDGYLMKSRKWSCMMGLMVETRICRLLRERKS